MQALELWRRKVSYRCTSLQLVMRRDASFVSVAIQHLWNCFIRVGSSMGLTTKLWGLLCSSEPATAHLYQVAWTRLVPLTGLGASNDAAETHTCIWNIIAPMTC
jgi:hypothetical protein